MAQQQRVLITEVELQSRLRNHIKAYAEAAIIPTVLLRPLERNIPLLARVGARNIAAIPPADLDSIDEQIEAGFRAYTALVIRRRQAARQRLPGGPRRATPHAFVARLPYCVDAPGLWPFCRLSRRPGNRPRTE